MKVWAKMKELMKNEEGFSLVELIIVMVLLVIAACVILALTGHAAFIKFVVGGAVGLFVLLIVVIVLLEKFGR